MAVAQPTVAAARPPKGWLATLAVALLMVGIVGFGFVAQNSVADIPARELTVQGVGIYPAAGWDFAGRSDDNLTILLTNGSGSLAVKGLTPGGPDVLLPGDHDPLDVERQEWIDSGTVTASDPEPVQIGPYTGRRFNYAGTFKDVPTPVEGTVTEIATPNKTVLFDGWAGEGQYQIVSDDIDAMIAGSVIP